MNDQQKKEQYSAGRDREIRAALDQHWAASDVNDFETEHRIYQKFSDWKSRQNSIRFLRTEEGFNRVRLLSYNVEVSGGRQQWRSSAILSRSEAVFTGSMLLLQGKCRRCCGFKL